MNHCHDCSRKDCAAVQRCLDEVEAPGKRAQAAASHDNHADALDRLRALRLWHWLALLRARQHERNAVSSSLMTKYAHEASEHLGFVQSLNDFFQPGDTAEADAAK